MENGSKYLIAAVAVGQFIPVFLYPPDSYGSVSPVIMGIGLAFFAFLGYYLIRRRPWAKTLTVFIQGFNVIARLMMLLANGAEPIKRGGQVNWIIIVTSLAAIILSGIILYRFDVPEVEVAFAG